MRKFRSWAGIAALLAAVGAQAQAPTEGEKVALAHKFQTGAAQRFKLTANTDVALSLGGEAGGGLGPIPISLKMAGTYVEKVLGIKEGAGTIQARSENTTMDLNLFGSAMKFKQVGGRVVGTVNGQPLRPDQMAGGAANLQAALNAGATTIRRAASGATDGSIRAGNGSGANVLGVLLFPANPVSVGESWTVKQKQEVMVPSAVGAAGGAISQELEMEITNTLQEIKVDKGRRYAIIATSATGEIGQGDQQKITQTLEGLSRFDIARGALASGKFTINISMPFQAPQLNGVGGQGGAGAPNISGPGRLDGSVIIGLSELPAVTKKAPAKRRR